MGTAGTGCILQYDMGEVLLKYSEWAKEMDDSNAIDEKVRQIN